MDQRRRENVKQMRKIDDVTDPPQDFVDERKEMWWQELQQLEHRRNDLLPEHQKKEKLSKKLQSLQDRKLQYQKHMGRWAIEAEKVHAEMEDNGQTHQAESLAEAELDLKIRALQAGEGRKGSNASLSSGWWRNLSR